MPEVALTRSYVDALRKSLAERTLGVAMGWASLERCKQDYASGRLRTNDRAASAHSLAKSERLLEQHEALLAELRDHLRTMEHMLAGRRVEPEVLKAQVLKLQLAGLGFGPPAAASGEAPAAGG